MKLIFTKVICLFLLLFAFNTVFAQAPQKMSYQAVIRNTSGNLIVDTPVGIKIAILQGSTSGTEVFSETHNPTTSSNGLASIEIGAGSPITGTFATINWGLGPFFIKTETDPTGGTNYTISGTSQLLSVPYALYAEKTKFQGRNSIYIQDNISNAQAQAILQEQFGSNTENIYVKNTKGLTNLDLSMVTNLTNLEITDNKDLVSVTANNLYKCYNSVLVTGNNLLTQMNFLTLHESNKFVFGGLVLQSFQLPQFTTAGWISITNSDSLTTINLPQYTSGDVTINHNNTLSSFDLPQYASGNVGISDNNSLTSFDLPQYTSGDVTINHNNNLSSFDLPQYTSGNVGISDSNSLTSFDLPQYTSGNVGISNNNSLTSFDLPQYTTGNLGINNNPLLPQVYLAQFTSGSFSITNSIGLLTINLPNLATLQKLKLNSYNEVLMGVGTPLPYYQINFTADLPNLKNVILPLLATVTEYIQISGLNIDTISMPLLASVPYFTLAKTKLTTLNITSLLSANLIKVRRNDFLQNVNFGSLVSVSAIDCAINPLLTSINLSSLSSLAGSATNYSNFANNALPSSQINAILHQLLSVSPSVPKTVGLKNQTPLAPPTGVGITDKATLISQGNNIATD